MGDQALSPNPPQFCVANLDQGAWPVDKIKNKVAILEKILDANEF